MLPVRTVAIDSERSWQLAAPGGQSNVTAPKDGDLFEAQIVGNIITVKLAGATMITLDVSAFDGHTFDSGEPGIGFDAGASGAETADSSYGFKDFSARGL